MKNQKKNNFTSKNDITSLIINIEGLVQGVGFRPFIYRTAYKNNIKGWVLNKSDSVEIRAEGINKNINDFIDSIKIEAPKNSRIENIIIKNVQIENIDSFQILKSRITPEQITGISPDMAVCNECLKDMKVQTNRFNYPFINCTNCGPRFSIIKDIPYDREKTTMNDFIMCESCKKEFLDINDRRFHAQPIACKDCGPQYILIKNNKKIKNIEKIIENTVKFIDSGKILAIKGLCGYNLVCDAFNENAVKRLRDIKKRDKKPFAVMFSDINMLKKYAVVSDIEKSVLVSSKSPIVLLNSYKKMDINIAYGLNTIGAMLPYMPIHYLLFERLKTRALIYTSGNISEEPIIIDDNKAYEAFNDKTSAILSYNREIYNRLDDSVARIVNNKEISIRRSRGYVPESIKLEFNVDGIIACGGELKNTVCLGKNDLAYLSQHIGDLRNIETYDFYIETMEKYSKLLRIKPNLLVCDMHPEYLSTKYAKGRNMDFMQIQHHHAHIASCMAENGINKDVIGAALDGTGFGDDGNIWGGEFFICNLTEYKRFSHFDYIPMPGGDRAIKEPWRMAVSYLLKAFKDEFNELNIPFLRNIDKNKIELIKKAVINNINSPLTSSTGRLFDGISALLGLCSYSNYEAEAPMELEALIEDDNDEFYEVRLGNIIMIEDIIKCVVFDIMNNVPDNEISIKFHNTVVFIITETSKIIRNKYKLNDVVLSGGIFQNKYILSKTENNLKKNDFNVYLQLKIPSNDGGISLGQLAIAANRRNNNVFKYSR